MPNSHVEDAMIYTSIEALSESIKANKFSLETILKSDLGMHCGENAGYGFDFSVGQTVEFPAPGNLIFQVITKVQGGNKVNYLYVSAAIDGKWQMVPAWALRKKTPSKDDLPTSLRENDFYMEIVRASNDVERVRLFAGQKWSVSEDVVTLTNPKTMKEYPFRIWSFDVVKDAPQGSSRKRR